jgi:hypothetical protein
MGVHNFKLGGDQLIDNMAAWRVMSDIGKLEIDELIVLSCQL